MELSHLFGGIYKGKKVFITGNTGFKGSWMAFWLSKMGATIKGYSLDIPTQPSHYELLETKYQQTFGDILNRDDLRKSILDFQPDIVFHLAAQSLVRVSYQNPLGTIETNVMGTANLLMTCLESESVKAVVNITSDKCYENKEWVWGYRENEPMGGFDPYSVSKGCAELINSAIKRSYYDKKGVLLASCRAGNVIGGGDWAEDRIMPDLFKSAALQQPTLIRNPLATRPWQHVLEPISGYLLIGQKLLEKQSDAASAWNFGPEPDGNKTVAELVKTSQNYWQNVTTEQDPNAHPHEARLLNLDCSKANHQLNWWPVWKFDETLRKTTLWYKDYYEKGIVNSENDLADYIKDAVEKSIVWTKPN